MSQHSSSGSRGSGLAPSPAGTLAAVEVGAAVPASFGQWARDTPCTPARAKVLSGSAPRSAVGWGRFCAWLLGEARERALGNGPPGLQATRPEAGVRVLAPWGDLQIRFNLEGCSRKREDRVGRG